MKKVAIYMPYAIWTPHFETDLELALQHLNAGDEVHVVQCRGELPACEPKENRFNGICGYCRSRSDNGLNLIQLPKQNRHRLDLVRFKSDFSIPEFATVRDLIAFRHEGVDVGEAVASSLITQLREPDPDMRLHASFVRRELQTAVAIHRFFLNFLKELKPDVFYVMNGRFASLRPALRAAQKLGIDAWTHERAGMPGKYKLIHNTLPQDLEWLKSQVQWHWENVSPPEGRTKEEIAAEWFSERQGGKDQGWISYTKAQQLGRLPPGFDSTKRNIAVFNSSEDEVAAFATWQNRLHPTQNAAIRALLESRLGGEFHFWLRMHPNLSGLDNSQTRELYSMEEKGDANGAGFTVIRPDAPVDSYHLMGACEKVIALTSTTGLEAAYWGKPSILLGRAIYEDLGCSHIPGSQAETLNLIEQVLVPKPRESTLKFAYWLKTDGQPYSHFEWGSLFTGRFLGREIKGSVFSRIGLKLSRHLGFLRRSKS